MNQLRTKYLRIAGRLDSDKVWEIHGEKPSFRHQLVKIVATIRENHSFLVVETVPETQRVCCRSDA
jgi:hypothetical protein